MRRMISVFIAFSTIFLMFGSNVSAATFDEWLAQFRLEALKKGISKEVLDAALGQAVPIERVVELDRKQPEFTMTFADYMKKVVSKTRIKNAKKKLKKYDTILTEVSKKYGVQKRFLVSFWGVETNFGQYLGSFNVPHSLATLSYDGRRSSYFRKELLNALQILEEGHIKPSDMKGSWAGAMGQSQFMPSSFLSYAVDWDGDGKRDIWKTKADVFASSANYLSKAGWKSDRTWGRQVRLPNEFQLNGQSAEMLAKRKVKNSLSAWADRGIRNVDGSPLPKADLTARIVLPEGASGKAFLVYSNFESILAWNRSNYYALAIGHLSDQLR